MRQQQVCLGEAHTEGRHEGHTAASWHKQRLHAEVHHQWYSTLHPARSRGQDYQGRRSASVRPEDVAALRRIAEEVRSVTPYIYIQRLSHAKASDSRCFFVTFLNFVEKSLIMQ